MIRIPRMFNTDKKPAGVGVGVGDGNGTMFKAKPRPKLERRNAIRNIDYALPSISSDDCLLLSSSSTSGLDFTSTTPSSSPAAAAGKQRARSLDIYRLDKNISFRIQGNCPGELEIICRSLGLSGPEDFAIPAAAWENMKVRSSSSGVFPRLSRFDYGDSINRIMEKDGSEDSDFLCTPSVNDAIKRRIENAGSEDSDFVCTPSVNDAINRKTVNAGSKDSDFVCTSSGNDAIKRRIEDAGSVDSDFVCIPSVNDAINRKTVNAGSKDSDFVCTPSGNDAIKRRIEDAESGDSDFVCTPSVSDAINQKIVNVGSKDNGSTVSDSVCTLSVNDAINRNTEGSGLRVLEVVATPASSSNGVLSSDKVDLGVRSVRSHNRLRYNHDEEVTIDNEGGNDLDSNHHVEPPQLAPPPAMSIQRVDSECSTWDILKSFAPDDDRGSEIRDPVSYEDEESIKRDDEDEEDGGEEKDVDYVANNGGLLPGSCSFSTTSNDDDSSSPTTMEPFSNISPYGRFRRTISYWEKGGLLGRGSFGSVYEGIADGGFFFAVKEVSLLDQGETAKQSIYQLEQEIALLSQFEHDNIVQYYGTDKDESKLYIFLELVTKGSLLSLYQKYHLQDSQVSAYTRQILHGLKYLHDQNVVHRDIKCANILVDASGSVKLADFGLAKATKLNDVKSCKGTPLWMAPEVVNRRNKGYGLAADIWSLGCTVLEMLTGQFPYTHLEPMAALFRIGKGEQPRVPESLSHDARDFILQCLQVNPNSRPTASQLLDHPFVQRSGSTSPYFPNRRA